MEALFSLFRAVIFQTPGNISEAMTSHVAQGKMIILIQVLK